MTTRKRKTPPLPKSPQDASQIDVALLAGVSQAAVSRVFTPGASVSEDTRAKVMAAVEQLGYRPNVIARSLVQNSTNIIGIVVKRFTNPFYAQMIQDFTRALQDKGYWALVINIAENQELEEALPRVLQYQVDGLIITSATLSSRMVQECVRAETPVVLFNRYAADGHTHVVNCDNKAGGKMVADAFLDTGHSRIAYIAGEESTSTNRDREAGFVEGLTRRGHHLSYRESAGEYFYEPGIEAARRLLSGNPRPDAVFCASDLIAMAVMDCARFELHLNIPGDLSVAGFDDIPSAAWPSYDLTTVRQPFGKLVDTTIEVLLNAIRNPDDEVREEVIPPTFIWRSSIRR